MTALVMVVSICRGETLLCCANTEAGPSRFVNTIKRKGVVTRWPELCHMKVITPMFFTAADFALKHGARALSLSEYGHFLGEPADDFAEFIFGEGLKRFSCHIAEGDIRQCELGRCFVVRKFRDGHSIILPHC
jgi:hypothetical protein